MIGDWIWFSERESKIWVKFENRCVPSLWNYFYMARTNDVVRAYRHDR